MNKNSLRFFAIGIVFLCMAIVFYSQGGVSLGKFLLFFASGAAFGANLVQGMISLRKAG
jgi:hypothetical protein